VVLTTYGSTQPNPSPDPAQAKRPGTPRPPKTVTTSKGGSLPGNPKGTGAGQGSVRRGGRGGR
jgi:hypothetical protein